MKKIIVTGNKNLSNLINIFEDIMYNIGIDYEIAEIDNNVSIHVFDNKEAMSYYVISNVDSEIKTIHIDIPSYTLITLGVNKKSSVTMSSLGGDLDTSKTLIYCIQREIYEENIVIEPQEIPVFVKSKWGHDIYNIMSAVTAALIVDINISDKLKKIYF
jgi:hypothetical protein